MKQQGVIYTIVAVITILPLTVLAQPNSNSTETTSNKTAGAGAAAAASDPGGYLSPLGVRCSEISSCEARKLKRNGQQQQFIQQEKSNCYCDKKCQMYDDCCPDSEYAIHLRDRIELGKKVHVRHNLWHCKRINSIFGDIVLRASCEPEWFAQQPDPNFAQVIKRRCEYVKDRGKKVHNANTTAEDEDNNKAAQLDPIGMMMPITDLGTGVTYANSYCLRCNTLIGIDEVSFKRRKVLYWSPLLECNYNTDSDERNTLFDLISSKKGKALHYSTTKNKWMIHVDGQAAEVKNQTTTTTSNSNNNSTTSEAEQRTCSIMPTIPDSVEHLVRHCRANTVRSCPPLNPSTATMTDDLMRARIECEFGHQSLTYSLTRRAVYYNQACAICNREKKYSCAPKSGRASAGAGGGLQPAVETNSKVFAAPGDPSAATETTTTEPTMIGGTATEEDDDDDELETNSAARANSHESSASGSFSVLMDLYGSSADEASAEQLLANMTETDITTMSSNHQPQCPQNQVFDPFYLTCRCVVCGLNYKFVEGRCVRKFKPIMVYLTEICLIISITSLALYLILYALSTFDLRPVAKQLIQWELEAETAAAAAVVDERESRESRESGGGKSAIAANQNSTTGKHSGSIYQHRRGSNEGSTASGPTPPSHKSGGGGGQGDRHSQSLSTRGVASLAGSLLAAYLLFMTGHQTETGYAAGRQTICSSLAVATYYCFLVAFAWMFLLAYDIWRTLRLATCRLRAPAQHSQSTRFLSYALSALVVSALLVGFAVLVDQFPAGTGMRCERQTNQNDVDKVLCAGNWWSHFVEVYKPKFGHQAGACWFSNRRALGLFFGLPVTLIMLTNLLFFLHSSCMVIRTSSRSSRQLSSHKSSTISQPKFESLQKGLSNNGGGPKTLNSSSSDFTFQNSLTTSSIISVQTLQSHLSAGSSIESVDQKSTIADEGLSPPPPITSSPLSPPDGDTKEPSLPLPELPQQQPQQQRPPVSLGETKARKAKLDTGLSRSSLKSSTNNNSSSTCSSTYSIASTLANRYDSHLQSIQSMMGSIVKDYRLYCRLSTILGLTWLTGLLASLVDQSETLWYLFVILNTLQGLFIFIAFGCKRSKLSNLELLFNYLKYWLIHRCIKREHCQRNQYKRKGSISSDESGP